MAKRQFSKRFLDKLKAVTAKRPKSVIEHILKHGQVTTDELRTIYGYNHPPRAARDVREQGIALDTIRVTGPDGRKIAAYQFADESHISRGALAGRRAFSKAFKATLVARDRSRCAICLTEYDDRYLQIDHCVPYQVSSDAPGDPNPVEFMLICGSCNRAKSWSCEHCENWTRLLEPQICRACYWASPGNYRHVAMRDLRRLDVVWTDKETPDHDRLASIAAAQRTPLPEFVKAVLRKSLRESGA